MVVSTKIRITSRFIGVILLTIIGFTIAGMYVWLKVGPENNVRMWLDKETAQEGDEITLHIRNLGSRSLRCEPWYRIFRVCGNITVEEQIFQENTAWITDYYLRPFTTQSHGIFTDLEPGEYYVEMDYFFSYQGPHYKRKLNFTIVG